MIKRHTISFKNALQGVIYVFKTQPNYRIHVFLSILSLVLGFVLKISNYEWLIILVLIIFGLVIETINTAIESTTDAIDNKWREDIKTAKDSAAGAMLICAIGAFVIAGIIFIPKVLNLMF